MNVSSIFSKSNAGVRYYQNVSTITEHTVRLYGEVKGNVPIMALVNNTYVVSDKIIFQLYTVNKVTRKSYADLYSAMIYNHSFVQWGKDPNLFAGKGMLVHRDAYGNLYPLFVLTVDVSDTSIKYENLGVDKFQLYLNQGFEQSHKSVFSKFKREFIPAILEEKPIDVISTFNINKLFGTPEYPKFKTIKEMNEFSQNILHGIVTNTRAQLGA